MVAENYICQDGFKYKQYRDVYTGKKNLSIIDGTLAK